MIGRIVKGVGGFYFVFDGHNVVMGKARGNLKRNKELIYVGDYVDFDIDCNDGDSSCVINRIYKRRNMLSRPPVSNLDILVAVFSLSDPEPNLPVIDKLTASCEQKGILPVICISKRDLVSEERLEEVLSVYRRIYPAVAVNGMTGEGIAELNDLIKGRSAALAGPSGVGKSTITNLLTEAGAAKTGKISDKTGRGRHTTRHVEIFSLDEDTFLFDTPGFTSLELEKTEPCEIRLLFPEFDSLSYGCRYSDCCHINEPDCAVKAAMAEGSVSSSRYNSYLMMMEEARKWQK